MTMNATRTTSVEREALLGVAIEMVASAFDALRDAQRQMRNGNETLAADFTRTAARDLSGALGSLHGL